MFEGKEKIEKVFMALSEQLDAEGVIHLEMVVCGGIALNMLGYIKRTTRDVDVIAFVDKNKDGLTVLSKAIPMKPELIKAAEKVKRDFNLPDNWLNAGPASVMDFGLPDGLMDRAETRSYGKNLIIHFLSRYDQIHFKLHAAVDQAGGKHYDDLMELKPSAEELEKAARWSITHDSSPGYRQVLKDFLKQMGHEDVAGKL
ncbi:MAG: hypothetical protein ISS26_02605 [Candidatus Omnitrophica bacterium]|nr:hypothetical protein [Candidatus Omnitrophota bacterium]